MTNSRICSVVGCGKAHEAKGWCRNHYRRYLRHGDPLGGRTPEGEPLAFLEGIVLSFEGDECLLWPFSKNSDGYGQIKRNGTMRDVHRIVCENENGPPPTPKHKAAHNCGKGHLGCCNRKHLRWATHAENMADMLLHGTSSRGERNKRSKLTEAQVLKIRASPGPQSQLAKEYGVAQSTVGRIKTRKRWAWMEDAA